MKIDIVHPGYLRVAAGDLERTGLGGNETAMVLASRLLAARDHEVRVFADCDPGEDQGARWLPLSSLDEREYRDVVIFWVRTKGADPGRFNAPVRAVKLGTRKAKDGLLEQVLDGSINLLIAFSRFQRDIYLQDFGFPASANWVVTADGLDITQYRQRPAKIHGKFLHAANPKRGLQHVLDMWPAIRSQHPAAELFIASSHLLRGVTPAEDRRLAGILYERAEAMANLGVRFLGRLTKPALIWHQLTAEFYLYPTQYPETCCIAALEAAAAGDVILCSPAGALPDRVTDGVTGFLVDGNPSDPAVTRKFLDRIGLLAEDAPRRERMAQAARDLAATHDYSRAVLPIWEEAFALVPAADPSTPPQVFSSPVRHPARAAGNRLGPFTARTSTSSGGTPMLPAAGNTPHDVLAVLRAHAARAAGEDQLLAIGAQPLSGGRNNAVYQWESPDGPVCVKIYQVDDRRRAEREWLSLTFLSGHQASSAPAPLWADPHHEQPAIGMTFLPGRPFPETSERLEPLRALAAVQRQYTALPLHGELATLERIDSASHYIHRITSIWAPVIKSHPRDALTRDLLQILSRWEGSSDTTVLAEPARRIFSRGDSNLLNWLWDRSSIRVVDYEFAGHSDLAFDCADLTEHISSRQARIDDQAWAEIASLAGLGDGDQRRFEAAQRTCALRWLAVLWKQRDNRPEEFTSQFDRVRSLQGAVAAI